MFYHYLPSLTDFHIIFNLFTFITFRAAGALVTSLLIAFILGPSTIRMLKKFGVGEVVRSDGPGGHLAKQGTPTMGGILIVLPATLSTLLWAELNNWYIVIALTTFLAMSTIGFMDDYLKVVRFQTDGLIARYKMLGQWVFGIGLGVFLIVYPISPLEANRTMLPFFSELSLVINPVLYVIFVSFVISGSSNAVNLTDGLDGLATGLVAVASATFGILAYLVGRVDSSSYLGLFYLPGAGELGILALAITGSCLGFLWYNSHPAEIFMGDTGALGLGGVIGAIAILLKAEFFLAIVGGVFIAEVLSVVFQVGFFRYTRAKSGTGKKIFRMAPLHHHFEELGWTESKVVVRFWVLGIMCAMVALSALKIR